MRANVALSFLLHGFEHAVYGLDAQWLFSSRLGPDKSLTIMWGEYTCKMLVNDRLIHRRSGLGQESDQTITLFGCRSAQVWHVQAVERSHRESLFRDGSTNIYNRYRISKLSPMMMSTKTCPTIATSTLRERTLPPLVLLNRPWTDLDFACTWA